MERDRQVWEDAEYKVSDGSADYDITLDQISPGMAGELKYITCENEDTAFTRLHIGIERDGDVRWYADRVGPVAGTKYWATDLPIDEGERVIVRFTGTTNQDNLSVAARGWVWNKEKKEG